MVRTRPSAAARAPSLSTGPSAAARAARWVARSARSARCTRAPHRRPRSLCTAGSATASCASSSSARSAHRSLRRHRQQSPHAVHPRGCTGARSSPVVLIPPTTSLRNEAPRHSALALPNAPHGARRLAAKRAAAPPRGPSLPTMTRRNPDRLLAHHRPMQSTAAHLTETKTVYYFGRTQGCGTTVQSTLSVANSVTLHCLTLTPSTPKRRRLTVRLMHTRVNFKPRAEAPQTHGPAQ